MSIQHPPPRYAFHKVVSDRPPADYIVDGVEDIVQIQSALDDLTQGRTWLEKVCLKGRFKLEGEITVPSYTVLDCYGAYFDVPSTVTANLFRLYEVNNIIFLGGVFASVKEATARYALRLQTCSEVQVLGTKIKTWQGFPIYMTGASEVVFAYLHIDDVSTTALKWIGYNTEVVLSHSTIKNAGTNAISITGDDISVAHCKIYCPSEGADGIGIWGNNNRVIDNKIEVANEGIQFAGTKECKFNKILLNHFLNSLYGVRELDVENHDYTKVFFNRFENVTTPIDFVGANSTEGNNEIV